MPLMRDESPFDCVDVKSRAVEYVVTHMLPVDERLKVAAHLNKCEECAAMITVMRSVAPGQNPTARNRGE